MNQNLLLIPFYPFINLFIITFLLLAREATCAYVDPQYLTCSINKTCGDGQIISFPFYIQDQQESFCGYPGFNLVCQNRRPVLRLRDDNYTIHKIDYKNQIIRVSNAAFFHTNTACVPHRFKNTSLPDDRFNLFPNQTELFLLSRCNSTLLGGSNSELQKYKVNCSGETEDGPILSMFDGDPILGTASEVCEKELVVPVDSQRGENEGIERMLERGFVLNWTASNCSICESSGGKCGFNSSTYHFRCFCPDRPHAWDCKPDPAATGNNKFRLKFGLGADLELGGAYFGVPLFSYTELEEATSNFDSRKELGDGGFGTVYYGKLRDGREVAVKRLYEHNYRRVAQFMNEIEILTRLRHKNLVTLYGCTSRRSHDLLLVYEYVPNGTVADHLHGDRAKSSPLTWPIRMSIAIETASALVYLHASDIIHRDVKTTNILLDNNFCVKVADFGLSRLFPNDVTHVSTAPQGTPGYVDPEYHQCYQLTDKSDVYSFGVVLIELISSMPAVDINRHRHEINLANLAVNRIQKCEFDELIDPSFGYNSDEEVKTMTITVAELAFRCLQQDKEMRPTMDEVLEELKRIESAEFMENPEEIHDDNKPLSGMLPPSSPPDCDDASLLKNIRSLPSPDTVTAKWASSCSTTPNVSGKIFSVSAA
ncbi:LEAF RUST 10 DISEASE-RESISTANCE LOCUS RECEPTOR-LIKE PROTEIN KINASE-like 1.2 isoform X3 [Hevea brasiliensis]|uniref:LEAF RUST 10 DISEASE-RESISTANCE LOCUS RECEPTOR-LIKE PROTEIN KINASE-like 1.2 isoform X3 n=1 Tax=Hevea brasiliensis TaxID=3981 RepID=UPI0025ED5B19|nr:LEAF RUST 10 DISEASE-RESISTANCE LOCUS RECEPTOR-LIKE PROTEIN KINASE-like 1.2 isoform X3 [Hevea brasiliensis]